MGGTDCEGTGRAGRRAKGLAAITSPRDSRLRKADTTLPQTRVSPLMRRCKVLLVVGLSLAYAGCHSKPNMKSSQVIVADRFARALAKGDFDQAHQLLSRGVRQTLSASELRKQYKEMTDYGGGPVTHVEVMEDMASWPGKQKADVAWVYVAMSGNNFSEAVTVRAHPHPRVSLVWYRRHFLAPSNV